MSPERADEIYTEQCCVVQDDAEAPLRAGIVRAILAACAEERRAALTEAAGQARRALDGETAAVLIEELRDKEGA